jgi:hypothetical protein
MIGFYKENQKMIHKLLINQIALSALGLMVGFPVNALAVNYKLGNIPNLIAGIFTALMFFFVVYDSFWEWGTKYVSKKGNNIPTAKTAALCALFAYIPTIILNIGYSVCYFLKLGALNIFKWILLLLCNGMHFGTLNFVLEYVPRAYSDLVQLIAFVLFTALTVIVCAVGLKVGISGKTLFAGYFHRKTNTSNK